MIRNAFALTSTQIGAIAESIIANSLMKESDGRLSPFWPIADDDGIDLLIYDKATGKALPLQVKSRTKALKNMGSEARGNVVHFEVRDTAIKEDDYAYLAAVLLSGDLSSVDCSWFIPMKTFVSGARKGNGKFVIRPNRSRKSKDRFLQFRCESLQMLAQRVISVFERSESAVL